MMRFDLHIHSCLSPCGDLENSPQAIVQRAIEVGLQGLMIADHNTSRNAPALQTVCKQAGLQCLFGMEITSSEEAHCLAVFDTVEQASEMTEICYAALPKRVNQPEIFGDQPVVNAEEEIEELEWRLLSAPTRLPLRQIGERVHALGGLFIAAHIDRPVFSVTSQLGGLSGDEGFDAVEFSRHARLEEWEEKALGLSWIRSSDAHYLNDVGTIWTEAPFTTLTVESLRQAFAGKTLGFGHPPCRR